MALSPVFPLLESVGGELRVGEHAALKQSDAEIAASKPPVNFAYPPGDMWGSSSAHRFGARPAVDDRPGADAVTNFGAMQDVLDSQGVVTFGRGTYDVSDAGGLLIKGDGQELRGAGCYGGTLLNWTGSAVSVIANDGATLRNNIRIRDLRVDLNGTTGVTNGIGIDFTHFSYSTLQQVVLSVYGSNTRGVYLGGRTSGDRPYYNKFDQVDIFSNNIVGSTSGSAAYYLDRVLATGTNYNGPNANTFMCGRIVGFGHGVRVLDGTGNTFFKLICESITGAHYEFGTSTHDVSGTATSGTINSLVDSGKSWSTNQWVGGAVELTGGTGSGQYREINSSDATSVTVDPYWRVRPDATSTYKVYNNQGQGNEIISAYAEGDAASNPSFLIIRPGMNKTLVRGGEISSLGSGLVINAPLIRKSDKLLPGNWSEPMPFTFYIDNLAASQTDSPLGIPGQVVGDVSLPGSWHIHSATTRGSADITAGSAQLWVTADGTKLNATADILLNDSNTFNSSGAFRQDVFPPSQIVQSSPSKRMGMVVTTDSGWAPTTNDIYVTLFVQIRG